MQPRNGAFTQPPTGTFQEAELPAQGQDIQIILVLVVSLQLTRPITVLCSM